MIGTQWARLRGETAVPLRRGAWYRVLRVTASDAVLDVHQRVVNVPLAVLQVVTRPPTAWAIVPRGAHSARIPQSWGPRYAVCPRCHARSALPKGPVSLRCPTCSGVFDVGWGDAYFA